MTLQQKLAHLKDPAFFQENRLPPHSDHPRYRSAEEALSGAESPFRLLLNGSWKFHHAPNPAACPVGYEQPGFSCQGWDEIQVPAHMELAGYGRPQYVDTRYPWDGVEAVAPHDIPTDYNPTGCYVTTFTVPDDWQGMPVHITLDGVETAFHLWCNGRYIGYSEDSYTPSEFDLTGALAAGENKLAVEVYRFCSGTWLEDQDFWRMGGIIRDVTLSAFPAVSVGDLDVRATLDDAYRDGILEGTVSLRGEVSRLKAVRWQLLGPDGSVCAEEKLDGGEERVSFATKVPAVAPWSAETPNLYTLLITLEDGSGCVEAVPCKVGFRRVEIIDKVLRLNGKRLVFYGVNRHEFSCDKGRTITEKEMRWDIRFLKQNNFNAVRTSHYPNQSLWYRLCDEYGIYVIDETNLETHGTWHMGAGEQTLPGDSPLWTGAVLDRAASMVERDKNHASVVIWSCGNESWGGKNLWEMSRYLRQRDPSRPVHYEGVCHDRRYPDTTDFESRMYTTPAQVQEYLTGNPDKPYLLCEYAHAMGNSTGNLHKYTALMDKYPLFAGGFIWDFADQTLHYVNPLGQRDLAIGGDFGDRPTDYSFCTNGLLYGDRTPSPKLQEVKYLYQAFDIRPGETGVEIRSRLAFSDGSIYRLHWLLWREGALVEEGFRAFAQAPLITQRYELIDTPPQEPGEYALEVRLELARDTRYAEKGHEAAFGQHVFQVEGNAVSPPPAQSKGFRVIDGDCTFTAAGEGFSVQFCKRFGRIGSLKYRGRELTTTPLQTLLPNFWRAPIDNDEGNNLKSRCATWKTASLYPEVKSVECEAKGNTAVVTTVYALLNGAGCTVRYTVAADGSIAVCETYQGAPDLPEMPCFGMAISVPSTVDNVRYYGLGPEENYIDRACGARLGTYSLTAAAGMSPYRIPQECGNRTSVRWVELTDRDGCGFVVSGPTPFEFSALPYTCHELENAYHHYELPPVTKTVLRLNHRQMGVGGDNAWGAQTHEEYRIPSGQDSRFAFTIRPV